MDNLFTLKDIIAPVIAGDWQGKISNDKNDGDSLQKALTEAQSIYSEINHQDKVVVKVSNTIETIAALLSVWYLGAVVIPAKSGMADDALKNIIDDCSAKYVLDPAAKHLVRTMKVEDTSQSHFEYLTTPRLTGVDLALIIYTSGSTGSPKGIMLTHNNVLNALRSIVDYLDIKQRDKILLTSPLSFDYGLYQLFFSLATGCELVVSIKPVNPINLVQNVKKLGITILPLIPALANSLNKYLERFPILISNLRLITSTGGVFPAHTAKGLQSKLDGVNVIKMYGLTESKRVSYLPADYLQSKSDSVGIPMPGLDAKIFSEQKNESGSTRLVEQPYGEIGQLYVRGSSVFQQYFDVTRTGGAKLYSGDYRDDNWLATGDLFTQDEEGFLYFKGRLKDLIKQRGFCIYPKDMEHIVYQNDNIETCSVVGIKDNSDSEVARLCVVLVDNSASAQIEFKQWLLQNIDSDYMFGDIQFLNEMPLSINGKVDVSQLTAAA